MAKQIGYFHSGSGWTWESRNENWWECTKPYTWEMTDEMYQKDEEDSPALDRCITRRAQGMQKKEQTRIEKEPKKTEQETGWTGD